MEVPGDCPLLRIGELSRRLGVSDHVLRAWENRYGLLQPVGSPGGFRLYSEADQWRIRRMQAYLADGLSAAEAARAALSGDASIPPGRPAGPPLAASAGGGLSAALRQVASLARRAPLALAGAGATAQIATAVGASLIAGDPVTEAERAGWLR